MDFSKEYEQLKNDVEKNLAELIPSKKPESLYEPIKYILGGGGKRIRPVLTMIAAGAAGGKPQDALYPAVALEIIHNFTLVHDDIMDRSPIRRGRTTIHEKWNDAVGILSGDLMIGHAYKILSKMAAHIKYANILDVFNEGYLQVCEGQGLDMNFNSVKKISLNEYLKMIEQKTSYLLISAVLMGAHTAKAGYETIVAMRNFAFNLGLGFQIQDDLLDMTADQDKFGKKTGQDIIEGKKTFLIIKATEAASDKEDINLLEKYFSENGLPEKFISKFQNMFQKLNIYDIAKQEIKKYFELAKDSLNVIDNNDYKNMLVWLADSLNKRLT